MTASLSAGDAIGNYIRIQAEIFRRWGLRVMVYADHIAPEWGVLANKSGDYANRGGDILWYHYSIGAENIEWVRKSRDHVVIDYHGISPPHLLKQNRYVAQLCQDAIDTLPSLTRFVDSAVVHSQYTFDELETKGFKQIYKIPLAIPTAKFNEVDEALAESLGRLDYLLFVGRVVPQKDMLALIDLHAKLREWRPELGLILVGSAELAPTYKREIERRIRTLGTEKAVIWAGKVTDGAKLSALFRGAKFYCAVSDWESFCVPVAEAAYCGTPAIVQDVPPLPEVSGTGGIVIDKKDLASAVEKILAVWGDEGLREQAWGVGQSYTDGALEKNLLAFMRGRWTV